jgi:peroxiredoxin
MAGARSTRARLVLVCVALVLVALGAAYSRNACRAPAARPAAPTFTVTTLDGAELRLEALRGKVVLLDFWATWCGPCLDEAPSLVALARTFGPRGVVLVGISMDDEAAPVRAFAAQQHLNYTIALGDAALGERFGGVLGLPVKFFIDRDGRIARRHDGPAEPAVLAGELEALLSE